MATDPITRGMETARAVVRAIADDDEPAMLAALNDATHEEVTWAAAYLASALREQARKFARNSRQKSPRLLSARALLLGGIRDDAFTGDVLMTQVSKTIEDAERGERLG